MTHTAPRPLALLLSLCLLLTALPLPALAAEPAEELWAEEETIAEEELPTPESITPQEEPPPEPASEEEPAETEAPIETEADAETVREEEAPAPPETGDQTEVLPAQPEEESVTAEPMLASLSDLPSQVELYVIEDSYADRLSLPLGYLDQYRCAVSGASYSVVSGNAVTVSPEGVIAPAYTVMYWNGGLGTSWPTGAEGERAERSCRYGTAKVRVTSGGASRTITVCVKNYAEVYARQVMDEYLSACITEGMTELEKLNIIAAFPAQYDYSAAASDYVGLIVSGGGDCWASSYAILYLCQQAGLNAHLRYGANDGGAGSGHRNVAVQIGDGVYIAEAGYTGQAPRYYSVYPENTGFCCRVRNGQATLVQYDGFDSDIVVPATYNGYPLTAIGPLAFRYGEYYSGVPVSSITLPDSLTTLEEQSLNALEHLTSIDIPAGVSAIGTFSFSGCTALTAIHVAADNPYYASDENGVLYNKAMDTLIAYPAAGPAAYTVPEGVTSIADYAFAYAWSGGVQTLHLPACVTHIGEGAFGNTALHTLFFAGDRPEITDFAFYGLTLTGRYPRGNATWAGIENEWTWCASSLTWEPWGGAMVDLSQCDITLSAQRFTYDGTEKKPAVTVTCDGETLQAGRDYTLTYEHNRDSGEAAAVVQGVEGAGYTGSVRCPFAIDKARPTLSFASPSKKCKLSAGTVSNALTCNSGGAIQYSTSNAAVAQAQGGTIRLKGVGTCTVTATVAESGNHRSGTCSYTLTVIDPKAQTLTVKAPSTLLLGKTAALTVTGAKTGLTYASSDTAVATVSSKGVVTAKAPGTVKVTVKAKATDQWQAASKTVTITVQCATPAVSKVENVSGGVKVTMNRVSGAKRYRVFYQTGTGGWAKAGDTTGAALTWKGAKHGKTYSFTVRAMDGNGKYISNYNRTGKSITYLSVPSFTGVSNSKTKTLKAAWKSQTGVTGYEVQYSTDKTFATGRRSVKVTGASKTSATAAKLTKGRTYYLRLRCYMSVSGKTFCSGWTGVKSVKIAK